MNKKSKLYISDKKGQLRIRLPKHELLFDEKGKIICGLYANIGDTIEIQDKESKNKTNYTYTFSGWVKNELN